jgi:hypothetical protein
VKLSVREHNAGAAIAPEVHVELYLEASSDGRVRLYAHRPGMPDYCNCLLSFHPDGSTGRHSHIDKNYPFNKDGMGRLDIDGVHTD